MDRRALLKSLLVAASLTGLHSRPAGAAMRDLEGRARDLDYWAGQTRLVNFWATWCGPCRQELPLLEDTQRRYGNRGFSVIGVALDTADAVSSFKQRFGLTYPLLVAGSQGGLDMMREYGNTTGAVPYSVLLSPGGDVLDTQLGAFDDQRLQDMLEKNLKNAPKEPQTQMTRLFLTDRG